MNCPRYRFTFTWKYLTGAWSFCCIYADDLKTAQKEFEQIPSGLYWITQIDQADNRYTASEPGYEPTKTLYKEATE